MTLKTVANRMIKEARKSIASGSWAITMSSLNFGEKPSDNLTWHLRNQAPDLSVSNDGFMGYYNFRPALKETK